MIRQYWTKAWLPLLCALIVTLLDQGTKNAIRANLDLYTGIAPVAFLGEAFQLEHVPNYGAAFGILQNAGLFFLVTSLIVSGAIIVGLHFVEPAQRFLQILLGMALGGALGNFIDRLTQGYVTDFLKFGIPGRAYWPTFNVADASITISVILLILLTWRDESRAAAKGKGRAQTPSAANSA